jgi:hypothetical protein
MAFNDEVRQIQKIKKFDGGVKSQREHINELVDAINKMIAAADLDAIRKGFAPDVSLYYFDSAQGLMRGNFIITEQTRVV